MNKNINALISVAVVAAAGFLAYRNWATIRAALVKVGALDAQTELPWYLQQSYGLAKEQEWLVADKESATPPSIALPVDRSLLDVILAKSPTGLPSLAESGS